MAVFFFVSYYFIQVNGVTYSVQSTIESIELDKNMTVRDAVVNLAGVDGEIIWKREGNDYFVSIVHGKALDSIKFSYNPSTYHVFLTGFYSSDGNKCEGSNQAKKCIYNAFRTF